MKTVNYQQLRDLENDIDMQRKSSPAFAFFNADKIKRFYQNNVLRITVMKDTIAKLQKQYAKVNLKGEPETIINSQGVTEITFNSEADKEEFNLKYNNFISTTFEIKL